MTKKRNNKKNFTEAKDQKTRPLIKGLFKCLEGSAVIEPKSTLIMFNPITTHIGTC